MPLPHLPALLSDLDGETHAARCQRMVALARAYRDSPGLTPLLDSLAAQSDYHAILALIAAGTAGDMAFVRRLAEHEHPRVARAARARLPLAGTVDQIVAQYAASSPSDRGLLRRRLAIEHRADVVDTVLRLDLADTERAGLLASASPASATAYLPDLADLIPNLTALAQRHPGLVLAHLRDRLAGAPAPVREHWWSWADPALTRLIGHDPGTVLALLESAPPTTLPRGIANAIGALIRHDPHRTATVLADPRRQLSSLPSGLLRNAWRFPPEDRVAIATRLRDDDRLLALFLDALPPSERAAIFDHALVDLNVSQRIWGDGVLDALPHEVRHREARRILALPEVRADIQRTIHYTGFLPAVEADERLESTRRAADPGERAAAYISTISAGARSREPRTLATALEHLARLRNEQDPVRLAVAGALQQIPAWLLADAGIGSLEVFATAVAAARDTSSGTLWALQQTVWGVTHEALRRDDASLAIESLRLIDILAGPTGVPAIPTFHGVPRGIERLAIDALLPKLRTAAAKDEHDLLFRLCFALDRRAWGVDELDSLLERALRARSDSAVRTAAGLWLADPATAAARVGRALAVDESLAVLSRLQQIISHSRQDLLGVLWKRTSLAGRLWGRRPRFVPILPGPFTRWLPRQVREYADALAALIATPGTDTRTATHAIRTLGRLPEIGTAAVQPYADSPDLALREAALAALAHADDPGAALARLLAVRTGDEVRVTMYAAGRCLRNVPAAVGFPLVADVLADPATKVTARKEAVRLLGLIRHPAALDLLLDVGLAETTHRDVRIAAARTVGAWLDDDRAWQVQQRVADLGREGLLAIAETEPSQLAERHRPAYARLLIPAAMAGDSALVSALGLWSPWLPEAMSLLGGVLTDPARAAGPAAVAIREGLRRGADWEPVLATITDLEQRTREPDQPDAQADSDQPARQRLHLLVTTASDLPRDEVAEHRPHLRRIVELIASDPALRGLALTIAARAIDWDAPSDGVWRAVDLVDEPLRCADLRSALDAGLPRKRDLPIPRLAELADDLISAGALASSTAALSIITRCGTATGWNDVWRSKLRVLRASPSAVITSWAKDVVTVSDLG